MDQEVLEVQDVLVEWEERVHRRRMTLEILALEMEEMVGTEVMVGAGAVALALETGVMVEMEVMAGMEGALGVMVGTMGMEAMEAMEEALQVEVKEVMAGPEATDQAQAATVETEAMEETAAMEDKQLQTPASPVAHLLQTAFQIHLNPAKFLPSCRALALVLDLVSISWLRCVWLLLGWCFCFNLKAC